VPGLERGPLEFTRLVAGDRLHRRALRERKDPPAALWARRSWFAIEGDRLLVQEIFLPESHA
jgi:chorismate--pyruvate lyase